MTQQLGRNVTTQLDRIITIQQLSVTRDSFGADVETWVDLAQVWASFTPQSAREQFRNESNIDPSLQHSSLPHPLAGRPYRGHAHRPR